MELVTSGFGDQIIKVLDNLGAKFGMAVDWTASNVMPYLSTLCTKIVSYEATTSILWICVALFVLVICGVATWWDMKYADKYDRGMLTVAAIVVGVCMVTLITVQAFDLVACYTFPEKIIIEYVQPYLK